MQTDILKYAVGIDVSKDSLAVCFSALDATLSIKVKATRSFGNTTKGFEQLKQWVQGKAACGAPAPWLVLEATGVYHQGCACYFHQQGFPISVVLPSKAKRYRQSLGGESKTDGVDAKALARMGLERKLEAWQAPDAQLAALRKLSRHRETLLSAQGECRNRLHAEQHSAPSNGFVARQLEQQLKMLKTQEEELLEAMEELLRQDLPFSNKVRQIADSVKGLGRISVATVAAETFGFESFGNQRQLTSYAGYDVVENQSGLRKGKTRISKKGNHRLRRVLHFPALSVVRHRVGAFPALYERVYERTRIKMKGYVAVQRKLLCLIYTLWKKDEAFVQDYQPKGTSDFAEPKPSFCRM